MIDVMVDLETLGTASDSAFLSIGAVEFSHTGLGRELYINVDPESCRKAGMVIYGDTVRWWMRQSNEARAAFDAQGAMPLDAALSLFAAWLPYEVCVWGNGASFDNTILQTAYEKTGQELPWAFYNDRCFRTLKNMVDVDPPPRAGTHHNALDDAKHQAEHAVLILQKLKGGVA